MQPTPPSEGSIEDEFTKFHALVSTATRAADSGRAQAEIDLNRLASDSCESFVKLVRNICQLLTSTSSSNQLKEYTIYLLATSVAPCHRMKLTPELRRSTNNEILSLAFVREGPIYHNRVVVRQYLEILSVLYLQDAFFGGWPELEEFLCKYLSRENDATLNSIARTLSYSLLTRNPVKVHRFLLLPVLDDLLPNYKTVLIEGEFNKNFAFWRLADQKSLVERTFPKILVWATSYANYFKHVPGRRAHLRDILESVPVAGKLSNTFEIQMIISKLKMFLYPGMLDTVDRVFGASYLQDLMKEYLPMILSFIGNDETPEDRCLGLLDIVLAFFTHLQPDTSAIFGFAARRLLNYLLSLFVMGEIDNPLMDLRHRHFDILTRMVDTKFVSIQEVLDELRELGPNPYNRGEILICARQLPSDHKGVSLEFMIEESRTRPNPNYGGLMMGGDSRKAHTAWILMRLCEIDPDIILKVPCSTLESLEFLSALLCPMKPISDSYFSNGYLIRYLPFSVVFSDDGVKSLLSKPNHLDLRALFNFLSSNQFILSDRDDDVDLTKFLIYERPQWLPKIERRPFRITYPSLELLRRLLEAEFCGNRGIQSKKEMSQEMGTLETPSLRDDMELICQLHDLRTNGWSKSNHRYFPQEWREFVIQLMMLRPHCELGMVPDEIFYAILSAAVFHNFELSDLIIGCCATPDDCDRLLRVSQKYPLSFFDCKFHSNLYQL